MLYYDREYWVFKERILAPHFANCKAYFMRTANRFCKIYFQNCAKQTYLILELIHFTDKQD